MGPVSSGIGDR